MTEIKKPKAKPNHEEILDSLEALSKQMIDLGFTTLSNSYPGATIAHNPNKIRTVLACYVMNGDKIEVHYFCRDGDLSPQVPQQIEAVQDAYDELEANSQKTPRNWRPFGKTHGNPGDPHGEDARIKFGNRPTRIYFMMLVPNWNFATLMQDAITSKLPVSNYYNGYSVIHNPDGSPNKYTKKICSIFNRNPFRDATHEYNLHCLVKIGQMDVPIVIDPKFENP